MIRQSETWIQCGSGDTWKYEPVDMYSQTDSQNDDLEFVSLTLTLCEQGDWVRIRSRTPSVTDLEAVLTAMYSSVFDQVDMFITCWITSQLSRLFCQDTLVKTNLKENLLLVALNLWKIPPFIIKASFEMQGIACSHHISINLRVSKAFYLRWRVFLFEKGLLLLGYRES